MLHKTSRADHLLLHCLASSSQSENVSTGTTIASSSVSNTEGAVTYSLTDTDNKFAINSSTGEVTLANALDYETKTSHEFTVTASDGVTTTSQTFTLSVSNAGVEDLAVTLANSGAALAESSSSGTAVASSSISNPENISISYSLSGTGSSNFAVDSSGNVTTNANLDFETAKSYSLTLTASGGGYTLTDNFTVNVGNIEELESVVLRYSAAFNSASRSGFSATATRGPSGSSLPAYILEQVGTTNTTDITSVFVPGNLTGVVGYVPVQIDSGTALNWRYYFPISHAGASKYAYRYTDTWSYSSGNRLVGYYGNLGTPVSTELQSIETITGGRLENGEYWFWVTDKAAADITYESAAGTYSTYNLYEDQVTLAGEVYKDANFTSFTNGNKRVIAMVMIPVDSNHTSTSSRYFYPNFIPSNFWTYDNVGLDYCQGVGTPVSGCTYNNSRWSLIVPTLDTESSQPGNDTADRYPIIGTSRFYATTNALAFNNELPEGMSMWWQVLNPNGVGVGLWAQISFKDTYDLSCTGFCGQIATTVRDDQQSLLNVVISNIDYRKNDTSRYSAGDTGLGMEGYHYWSYQGPTNVDNNGLGITYGTSPIECATSHDSACFWGDTSNQPGGAMLTSSDPYKSGNMTVGVNYNSNNDTFSTGTFQTSAVLTDLWGPLAISGIRLDSSFRDMYFSENTNCTDSTCAIHSLENGDAFAVSILFYLPVGASDETIPLWGTRWSSGNGNVDSGEVFMRIVNGKIVFQGGRQGSNTLKFEGDDTLTEGKWYGLYLSLIHISEPTRPY